MELLTIGDIYMHNQVVVSTKSPRSDKQYVWESEADSSSYIIKEETDPEKQLQRGTQITLYLRVLLPLYLFSHYKGHYNCIRSLCLILCGTFALLFIWVVSLFYFLLLFQSANCDPRVLTEFSAITFDILALLLEVI